MTELTTIVAAERAIDIKHPATEVPVGLRITLLPDTHPKVREASRKALDDRLQGKGKVTAAKMEQGRTDMLVASVGAWEWQGDLTFHGAKPPLTDESVRKVLKELPWIGDQLEVELGNRAEFFRSAEDADL
ncbi:hypothetical protein [Xanthomonas citri]|uniref:hypothetical protein n=1 Tax=Xanthomonas citri TaxID=346 RepID=UPI0004A449DC|nr:hypothetical protein [Xanthomonas citri]QTK36150.1 hypothetical protein XcgCFBP2526_08160 [Xanthomonas citri pv. glycines CFBP 2526]QTK37263.1 hypothetical protein XcgCFBP7119R_12640 [Xanthomonas citri pv. glycines]UIX76566.1 hypothetical protein LMJ37_02905 [Xanthomonas citri pv. glycines]